jgi:hypothetical protein
MLRSVFAILVGGVVGAALWLAPASKARANDVQRYYYYPFYYFPHNYWPGQTQWPDPRQPFQRPPAYMAYPPYLDPMFRYELFTPHRYYRGFHFWLDQF